MSNEYPCFMVNNLTSTEEQCNFVTINECLEEDSFIDYVSLVYCDIGFEFEKPAIILLALLAIILFIALGSAANEFLCPSLLTLSKILRMSDSVAGVTLLAFGNGCPDIFSSIAAASDDRPELIVSELLGAGIFCTSIVSGLVFINGDFKIATRPMLRDTILYMLAAYIIWFACWNGVIKFSHSIVLILIYIVYLIVALTGQHVLKKHRESQREKKPIKCGHPIEPSKTIREKTSSTTNDKQDYGTLDRAENRGISSTQSLGMFRISSGFGIFRKKRSIVSASETERGSTVSLLRYMRSFDDDDIAALASKSWHSMPAHGHFSNALRTITKSETNNNRPQQPSVSTIKVPDIERIELKDSIQSLEPITYSNVPSTALSDQDEMTITTNNTTVTQLSAKHLLNHEIYDSPSGKNTRSEVRFCKLDAHADLEDENYIKFLQSKAEIEHHLQSKLPRPSETPSLTSLNEWDDLLLHVCPIDVHNWKNFGTIDRIFEIIRAPLYFIMILTVPVVDYESRRHNWCKMLNALHCISVPVAITILTHTADVVTSVWDLPLYMLVVGPGVVAFFIVLTTSEALAIPPYHSLFAYIGFLMSILWIYSLATEVISLLKTIGVVFSMSDAAIGLGILAWGNSLGDIAANLTLAKSGYPRMALGACIGAPLLNSLLGFGLSFSLSLGPGGQTSFAYTHTLTLLYITITTILMTLMLTTLLPSNVPKKFLGYGLISLYFVYFCAAILLECGYIQ